MEKRKKHVQAGVKRFSADELMHKVMHYLIRDFQDHADDPLLFKHLDTEVSNRNVAGIRNHGIELSEDDGPWLYKVKYQMISLNKRHRYHNDIYTDEELVEKSVQTFLETQHRVSSVSFDQADESAQVVEFARLYIAKVLGEYDDDECRQLARFGSGATVGVSARKACLAERFELPITGSEQQIEWFDAEMRHDIHLLEHWRWRKWVRRLPDDASIYQPIDTLKLSLVPKSFKSLRSIMPNSTIGSYMSQGLGEMIRKRLKRNAGIDIRYAQGRHRDLACAGSIHGLTVTADLSSASDSISVELVKRLMPLDWYDILTKSRIANVQLPDGKVVVSNTFCTMGVGYTFSLQTLIFLALLKGVEATMFHRLDKRTISVYGDDMIYFCRQHEKTVKVFNELGFIVNVDKTFATGHFRESCGGDYYRGVDVRPFQPLIGQKHMGHRVYEAVLYKAINGLLMRWSEYEIERTLRFLASEVERVSGKINLVPQCHPDDSGIKISGLHPWDFLSGSCVAKPKHVGHGLHRFSFLRLTPMEREEERHGPYLWAKLRQMDVRTDRFDHKHVHAEPVTEIVKRIQRLIGSDGPPSYLVAKPRKDSIKRSAAKQCRKTSLRVMADYVTISHTGRYNRQFGVSLFEIRR